VAGAEAMRLGDPLDEATEVGPLSSREHWEKVTGYLDLAAAEGAKVRTGGRGDGWWVRPTVLVDVRQDMAVCREEIFGPVVVVQPFDTDEEAVALANDSPYGLNAMVFTESLRRAHQVAAAVRAGTIWVNCFFVRDLRAPFGATRTRASAARAAATAASSSPRPRPWSCSCDDGTPGLCRQSTAAAGPGASMVATPAI
jgi:aminomuconate-semialdehyde/2-hydroxymuconate-6-semialdehyde dehydrogenase